MGHVLQAINFGNEETLDGPSESDGAWRKLWQKVITINSLGWHMGGREGHTGSGDIAAEAAQCLISNGPIFLKGTLRWTGQKIVRVLRWRGYRDRDKGRQVKSSGDNEWRVGQSCVVLIEKQYEQERKVFPR